MKCKFKKILIGSMISIGTMLSVATPLLANSCSPNNVEVQEPTPPVQNPTPSPTPPKPNPPKPTPPSPTPTPTPTVEPTRFKPNINTVGLSANRLSNYFVNDILNDKEIFRTWVIENKNDILINYHSRLTINNVIVNRITKRSDTSVMINVTITNATNTNGSLYNMTGDILIIGFRPLVGVTSFKASSLDAGSLRNTKYEVIKNNLNLIKDWVIENKNAIFNNPPNSLDRSNIVISSLSLPINNNSIMFNLEIRNAITNQNGSIGTISQRMSITGLNNLGSVLVTLSTDQYTRIRESLKVLSRTINTNTTTTETLKSNPNYQSTISKINQIIGDSAPSVASIGVWNGSNGSYTINESTKHIDVKFNLEFSIAVDFNIPSSVTNSLYFTSESARGQNNLICNKLETSISPLTALPIITNELFNNLPLKVTALALPNVDSDVGSIGVSTNTGNTWDQVKNNLSAAFDSTRIYFNSIGLNSTFRYISSDLNKYMAKGSGTITISNQQQFSKVFNGSDWSQITNRLSGYGKTFSNIVINFDQKLLFGSNLNNLNYDNALNGNSNGHNARVFTKVINVIFNFSDGTKYTYNKTNNNLLDGFQINFLGQSMPDKNGKLIANSLESSFVVIPENVWNSFQTELYNKVKKLSETTDKSNLINQIVNKCYEASSVLGGYVNLIDAQVTSLSYKGGGYGHMPKTDFTVRLRFNRPFSVLDSTWFPHHNFTSGDTIESKLMQTNINWHINFH